MSDVLRYPAWQSPLQDLILEFDAEEFSGRIQEVEALIYARLQELHQGNDGHEELDAINDGLSILRKIKRDRLGYPDWK